MAYLGRPASAEVSVTGSTDTFTGDGNVVFSLSRIVKDSNPSLLEVFVSNVQQQPTVTFSVSGNVLTFTSAPGVGEPIYVTFRDYPVAPVFTVPDASITTAKLANNAVTSDKIGSIAVTEGKIANQSVTEAKVADGAITNAKLNLTYSSSAFLANGSANVFTIDSGHDANSILVFVNGIGMLPVADYGVSGTTLTLLFTPVANSNVSVRYFPV